MIRAAVLGLLLAACGDSTAHTTDAPTQSTDCTATFTGNFGETSTSPDNCPSVGPQFVTFMVPVQTLATTLAVAVDLGGPPTPGSYSSQSTSDWQATATQNIGGRYCFYTAGSATSPHGSFTLTIDSVDGETAHGKLAILQYVLAGLNARCGPLENETITLAF